MKKRQLILGKLIPFWIVGMTVIEFFYLIGFAVVLNSLAIYNYRKTN